MQNNWWDTVSNFLTPPAYADAASISPKGVAYVESRGMTPEQKRTPGKAGEIGKYQLTPGAFEDLQKWYKKYRNQNFFDIAVNDSSAKKAMMDYMQGVQDNYFIPWAKREPTDSELLQMYNVGAGNYRRGRRNPEYVQSYLRGAK